MNIPNLLSIIRICLVPAFILTYFSGIEHSAFWAAGIYIIASITDVLDGRIARKYNLTTNLGRILDPLGDKLMTLSVLCCITIDQVIPLWALAIVICKELLMGIGGMIIIKKFQEMPPSNYFGKSSTVVFFAVCVILMLFRNIPTNIAAYMISFAIVVMILAFVSYLIKYITIMRGEHDRK